MVKRNYLEFQMCIPSSNLGCFLVRVELENVLVIQPSGGQYINLLQTRSEKLNVLDFTNKFPEALDSKFSDPFSWLCISSIAVCLIQFETQSIEFPGALGFLVVDYSGFQGLGFTFIYWKEFVEVDIQRFGCHK